MKKMSENVRKQILSRLKALILVCIVYYAVTWFTGCPIRYFLGISCPGCGMTRAWLHVLRLDFAGAFAAHPLFWTAPLIAAAFLLEEWTEKKGFLWGVTVIAVIFTAVYLVRLIWFPDEIVYFRPKSGMIGQILCRLFCRGFVSE